MKNFVNLCKHDITLQAPNGDWYVIPPSGTVARVATIPAPAVAVEGFPCLVAGPSRYGEVYGLPAYNPESEAKYIVSGVVGAALREECERTGYHRDDTFVPGTAPEDNPVRNEKGHVVAVTVIKRA